MPPFIELEKEVAAAKDAYSKAKKGYDEASRRHSALVAENEAELANKKGKVDPAVEAEIAELEAVAAECMKTEKATKRRLKEAERVLAREKQSTFVKMKSERLLSQSRATSDVYAAAADEAVTGIDDGLAAHKEAARSRQLRAREAKREEARKQRAMHFATHVESFATGWRGSWQQLKPFTPAPRAPPTVWLPPEPPPASEPEGLTKLKEALGRNLFRVVDLFTRWDVDCDHTISKEELRLALNSLGVPFDEQTLQALFIELDADRSGDVDFEELHGALRKHVPKRAPPNHISLEIPKRREPLAEGTGAERRAVAALKKALHIHLGKISGLFAAWDDDGNGQISKKEVKRALAAQSIPVDDVALNTLFKKLDADGSGGIDFKELNKLLRREFLFESEIAQPKLISVGDLANTPYASAASLPARPHTSPAMSRSGTAKGGARPTSQHAARIAFEKKMKRDDHADLAVIFAEREEAAKKPADKRRDQNLTVPPSGSAARMGAAAPAADMVRSRTEPKLVKR